jgi:hypothetical protein
MEGVQRAIFHLFLVLFLVIVTPIAVFMVLVGVAKEFIVDRLRPLFANVRTFRRTPVPMKPMLLIAALFLPLVGCSIPLSRADGGPVANHEVDPASRVLILNIADGQEIDQPIAPGSGQGLVAALGKVMSAHGVQISTTATSDLSTGIAEARKANFGYIMKSTITLWEDNATAWSGNGDKLSIYVELYDSKSRELVAAATHRRVATGATLMAGSPDRFLDQAATGALGKIYGWDEKDRATQAASAKMPHEVKQGPPSDADAMNTELRRLASDSQAHGDSKAAKEYLDMIVPSSSQH